jgi:hypothetical protein
VFVPAATGVPRTVCSTRQQLCSSGSSRRPPCTKAAGAVSKRVNATLLEEEDVQACSHGDVGSCRAHQFRTAAPPLRQGVSRMNTPCAHATLL